jgi:hypothetical protein
VDDIGQVGDPQVLVCREQQLGVLARTVDLQPADPVEGHQRGLTAAPGEGQPAAGRKDPADESLVDDPLAAVDGDVQILDGRVGTRLWVVGVGHRDPPVEQLSDGQVLGRALLEPPEVDQAGRDDGVGIQ